MSDKINFRGDKNRPLTQTELDNNFRFTNEWKTNTPKEIYLFQFDKEFY